VPVVIQDRDTGAYWTGVARADYRSGPWWVRGPARAAVFQDDATAQAAFIASGYSSDIRIAFRDLAEALLLWNG
jgi:hypothetical protein